MTSRRGSRGAAIASLCLGLLLAMTGCGGFDGKVEHKAAPVKAGPSAPPVVMFLGDSYTVGERGAQPETTYAPAAARLLGWQVIAGGRAGTGFVAGGTPRLSGTRAKDAFGELFEAQLGWRPAPDMLVVSGGHNDWHYPTPQVIQAARTLLTRAHQRWPGTSMLLIGPLWGSDTPPPGALAVRDGLKALAAELRIPFIDPIAEHWITGNRHTGTGNAPAFIKPDGVHPTVDGHRYIATKLADDIRRLGLAHPARRY